MTWRELLEEFKVLGPNWDSYGGDPITTTAAGLAEELLSSLPEPYAFAPIADGGLFAEWHVDLSNGKRKEIEICIHGAPEDKIDYLVVKEQLEPAEPADRYAHEGELDDAAEAVAFVKKHLASF